MGPIGDGLEISHSCKNKQCVRPDHLSAISPGEHAKVDRYRRLAKNVPKNEHPYWADVRGSIESINRLNGVPEAEIVGRAHERVEHLKKTISGDGFRMLLDDLNRQGLDATYSALRREGLYP